MRALPCVAVLAILLGLAPVGASERGPGTRAVAVAEPRPTRAVGEASLAPGRPCLRSRKKFWSDVQGWIVRRVAICR